VRTMRSGLKRLIFPAQIVEWRDDRGLVPSALEDGVESHGRLDVGEGDENFHAGSLYS